MVKQFFQKIRLTGGHADLNLFIGNRVYILLFIDNMMIIRKMDNIQQVKAKIAKEQKCEDLRPAKVFVRFQIIRDRLNQTIQIYQEIYIQKILKRFRINNCNPKDIPIPAGIVLQSSDQDLDRYALLEADEASLYRQIVRSTIYLLNCTRPDILYIVGQLARHIAKPNKYHLRVGKLLLRYL